MSRADYKDAENTSNAELFSIATMTADDYRVGLAHCVLAQAAQLSGWTDWEQGAHFVADRRILIPSTSHHSGLTTCVQSEDVRMERREADPTKVRCYGDGLKFGYINQPINATIDTRNAGPGELIVYCNGAEKSAFCDLRDHHDGTFTLTVRAQDVGLHSLFVKYENVDVPGSPFSLRVSPASLVRAAGPGLKDGVLQDSYDAQFAVNTAKAGRGDLKIRIGGPRGGFRTQTKREGPLLLCRYNPKRAGTYVINIVWDGDHLPHSPIQVNIFNSMKELRAYQESRAKP